MKKCLVLILGLCFLVSACSSTTVNSETEQSREKSTIFATPPAVTKPSIPESATVPTTTPEETTTTEAPTPTARGYYNGDKVSLKSDWEFADSSEIHSGAAVMYVAEQNRKDIVIGVNAGHGTTGGSSVKTYCHPDRTAKVTGGTTAEGSLKAIAVSSGMEFNDGTPESKVTLRLARILRDLLLEEGYDVLMLRDDTDVQLDNVARTVICNNVADCHIALHWDGDEGGYDKGCFYMSVPDGIKDMYPVTDTWKKSEKLGDALIEGLRENEKIFDDGSLDQDLTQTSYSKVPSIDIEMGNEYSNHDDDTLTRQARGLLKGINIYFEDSND